MIKLMTILKVDRACCLRLLGIEFDILFATKGTWRRHPVKARLFLSIFFTLIFPFDCTVLDLLYLVLDEADGGLADYSVRPLKNK